MGGCICRLLRSPATPQPRPTPQRQPTPPYAHLRNSPDLLTQQVWANVFLEEAEEEEYNRDEGKAEEDSEGEEAAD